VYETLCMRAKAKNVRVKLGLDSERAVWRVTTADSERAVWRVTTAKCLLVSG